MRGYILLIICALIVSAFLVERVQAQQDAPDAPSASAGTKTNDPAVEGTVVSTTRHTLVVRSDDDQYHLFTYDGSAVRKATVQPGARVLVNASALDDEGTQVAENVTVIKPVSYNANSQPASQAAPPPPQVQQVSDRIENEARRWHAGGRIGVGFSPELFLFGVQSQIGPFFKPRLLFRPNTEFAFGELTDMVAVNLEAAYRFNTTFRRAWTPYFGLGPSLNFIHQGVDRRDVNFGNFDYKTGFNILVGAQKRNTFAELKTSLWSGPAPVLRLIVGYNF